MDPLDTVFAHLDRWRHLPNYQLERRADILFSVYLRGLLEEVTGVPLEEDIIPELPIKRDLIWPELRTNKSVKVDYALFAKDRSRVFLVELKTDAASRRDGQDTYLETAKRIGFRKIVEGIRDILVATSSHGKYHHLAHTLSRLGFLEMHATIADHIYPTVAPTLKPLLKEISVSGPDPRVEIVYVQPEATVGDTSIDFARFAEYVAKFDDPLSRQFEAHLRRWRTPAGSHGPV